METLVIKNNLLTGGSGKLYRDVIVNAGTLLCLDFSNKGCLTNDNLSTVRDLAKEAKDDLSIPNNVQFKVTDRGTVPPLTTKKGYPIVDLGSYSATANDSGLQVKGIDEYLFAKQPHSLMVLWLDCAGTSRSNLGSDNVIASSDSNAENIRLTGGAGATVSLRFGGIGFVNYNVGTNVSQLAVEYIDSTQPLKLYVNGRYYGLSSANGYGFKAATANPLNIGAKTPLRNTTINLYRPDIFDLTKYGKTALEVVERDYNYVNALGEFEGITKRPYANI